MVVLLRVVKFFRGLLFGGNFRFVFCIPRLHDYSAVTDRLKTLTQTDCVCVCVMHIYITTHTILCGLGDL